MKRRFGLSEITEDSAPGQLLWTTLVAAGLALVALKQAGTARAPEPQVLVSSPGIQEPKAEQRKPASAHLEAPFLKP